MSDVALAFETISIAMLLIYNRCQLPHVIYISM